jgi:enoyl-CoA hydratase/carnithine racemase
VTENRPLIDLTLGRIAMLVLDDPPLNLLTGPLLEDLEAALEALEAAEPGDVRAVVLTGRGDRAFSVGSNVKEFEAYRALGGSEPFELEARVAQRLAALPMPTIGAIEGDALGGGLELALCCDLRVAADGARIGLPEVRLAVTPSSGGSQRLPRIVGVARAKELLLTGRIIDAAAAERIGLVNEVVPRGQAVARAREIGEEIAERVGPLAVRAVKALVDDSLDRPLADGHAAEVETSVRIFATDDLLEGARSFVEKRNPEYRGR